jgi:hypothetical protein
MITELLKRLTNVKKKKENEWLACCPVHPDKNPSMGIKLTDDGKILCRCFGCGASGVEIIQAVGMDVTDLFPPKEKTTYKHHTREYFNPATVLSSLAYEAAVLERAAFCFTHGEEFTDKDRERIDLASQRISDAKTYCFK